MPTLGKCFPCFQFRNDEVVTKLDFANTVLTDIFPEVWQHERTLEELYLTSTRLNNLPPQLFYCQGLRVLSVSNNNLETIPSAIGTLRQLNHLNINRNFISSVPDNIKSCKNLTYLDLSCNNLQRLPDAITCLIALQELFLNETYLEFLPANFGRLVNLRILELRLNGLVTLPKSMGRLCNLQRIDIGGNEFTELPEVIGELCKLRELWIDFNQIRRIPSNIGKLQDLQHFEANGNLIDTLPADLSNWRHAEVLSICSNNLQSLPNGLGMLKSLVTLKCETCELRELPDSISSLEQLEELVVSHNYLKRLPTTIGMLRKLRFLFADANDLQSLPDELCSCSALSVLSVSRNKLTDLPWNIGHLTKLKVLNLVDNCISTLPVSVLSLINLTSLWVSDNQSQPLVPLQYTDAHEKTRLTCFMLPQVGAISSSHLQNGTATGSYAVSQKSTQKDTHGQMNNSKYTDSNSACTSPSRRICFADDAIVFQGGMKSFTSNKENSYNTNSSAVSTANEDQYGPRLMRSPTPYPKELRMMAKYMRVGQKATQKSPELLSVKEARVVMNTYANNCDIETLPTSNYACNDEIQSQLAYDLSNLQRHDHTSVDPSLISNPKVPRIEGHDIGSLQQQQQQQPLAAIIPDAVRRIEYQIFQPNQDCESNHVQSFPNPDFDLDYSQQNAATPFYAVYYGASALPNYTPLPTYDDTDAADTELIIDTVPAMASERTVMLQQTQQPFMTPPPYHIARNYTKKTIEDLSNYDTVRRHQYLRELEADSLAHATEINSNSGFLDANLANALPCDHENNVLSAANSYCSNGEIPSESIELTHSSVNAPATLLQQSKESNDSPSIVPAANECSFEGSLSTSGSSKRTPWLFGVHKNPTVKQITIKCDNSGIGFDIGKRQNEEGIYVISTAPKSNAARLLCVHDKLLEIDGYDFTHAALEEAKSVLANSGAVINIMLSRK